MAGFVWAMIFLYPFLILLPVFIALPPAAFFLSFRKPVRMRSWLRWLTPVYALLFLPCIFSLNSHAIAFFAAYALLVPWCFLWCCAAARIHSALAKHRRRRDGKGSISPN